jgi:hypothetical protein
MDKPNPRLVISQHPIFDCQYKPGKCQLDQGGDGKRYCIWSDKDYCPWRVENDKTEDKQ